VATTLWHMVLFCFTPQVERTTHTPYLQKESLMGEKSDSQAVDT